MLYLTTRDINDAHTAYKTLTSDIAADGGMYLPFRLDPFAESDISALRANSFCTNVAKILNLFFNTELSGWNVETIIGKNSLRNISLNRKLVIAQVWHNLASDYAYTETNLFRNLSNSGVLPVVPTNWAKIAIRVAVVFGIYGAMLTEEQIHIGQKFDVAVLTGDFSEPTAMWLAREMGLPIGRILCTCEEPGAFWDLVHRGQLNTTQLSESEKLGLERLIYLVFGREEALRYRSECENRGVFAVAEEQMPILSEQFFCSVVGSNRAMTVINSVLRANSYLTAPKAASAYGVIQDFRGKTGNSTITLLTEESDPEKFPEIMEKATCLQMREIKKICKDH